MVRLEEIGTGQAITNWQRSRAYWYNRKTGHILDLESKSVTKRGNREFAPIVTNRTVLNSIKKRISKFKIKGIKIKTNTKRKRRK